MKESFHLFYDYGMIIFTSSASIEVFITKTDEVKFQL